MPQSIHWYVRKMPQSKIWSVSVKITIFRCCMDCRSQGPPSGIPPDQKQKENIQILHILTGKCTWYWGERVGLSVGIATLNRRPLGMQMHSWNWPTSPWKRNLRVKTNQDSWPSIHRLHGAAWQCRERPLLTIPQRPPRFEGWCPMLRSRRPSCLQSEQI